MIAMTKPPAPFTAVWRSHVANALRDGYGAEDIAIRLACTPAVVRREVSALRASGKLACAEWWGRK